MDIMTSESWYSYSNTLLVSLNSRIAIREESSSRRALPPNRTLTVSTSRNLSGIVHVKFESSPHAFEGRRQSGEDGSQAKATGECCGFSFLVVFQHPDLIDRHRMIWILNGKMSLDDNRLDGVAGC